MQQIFKKWSLTKIKKKFLFWFFFFHLPTTFHIFRILTFFWIQKKKSKATLFCFCSKYFGKHICKNWSYSFFHEKAKKSLFIVFLFVFFTNIFDFVFWVFFFNFEKIKIAVFCCFWGFWPPMKFESFECKLWWENPFFWVYQRCHISKIEWARPI